MNMAFVITVILSFFTLRLLAAPMDSSYEMSCRAKAKEIAAETYRGCVTEYKAAEIEHLRRNYQEKLKAMKNEYEQEISKLGGKTKSKKAVASSKKSKSEALDYPEIEMRKAEPQDDSQMDLPEPVPAPKDVE